MKRNLEDWVCHPYKRFFIDVADFNGGFGVAFYGKPYSHSFYLTDKGEWIADDYFNGKTFKTWRLARRAVDKVIKEKNFPPGY